jgi:hypothetical protein
MSGTSNGTIATGVANENVKRDVSACAVSLLKTFIRGGKHVFQIGLS